MKPLTKCKTVYPKREDAVFDAFMSATANGLLVSECQDFISYLRRVGYVLHPIKKMRATNSSARRVRKKEEKK